MKIETVVVGLYQTNCYILHQDGHMIVVDPGASVRKIEEAIAKYPNEHLEAILLTHGHFDHIGAVNSLYKKYQCPVYISEYDERLATDEDLNSLGNQSATIDVAHQTYPLNHLSLKGFEIEVLDTPGHTEGSVCLLIDGVLFAGDTVFFESVGRTDLYGGSGAKLYQSLQMLRLRLEPSTVIYPGHGCATTWGHELNYNPYM